MANCNELFYNFNENITLTHSEKNYLRKARSAVTTKIINNFSSKKHIPPIEFKVQGSFTMDTIIRPLNGEFDIDIGIYFKFPSSDPDKWPVPQTVSGWVYEAIKNHTSTPPENKTTCVRLSYKPISKSSDHGYHVDLPIYGECKDGWGDQYKVIGINDDRQWNEKSDPSAFTKWFDAKCLKNEKDRKQLIRIVKYLKAWKDFQTKDIKMPSGMILTIVAAKNFQPNERDDIALYKTIDEIHFNLWWGFWVTKPIAPGNNLVAEQKFSTKRKEFFMERLMKLRNDSRLAINSDSYDESSSLWRRHFGNRF